MKIRFKLTLYFTYVVAVLFIARSITNYWAVRNYSKRNFYHRLQDKGLIAASRFYNLSESNATLQDEQEMMILDTLVEENITIYDSLGSELFTNNPKIEFILPQNFFPDLKKQKSIEFKQRDFNIIGFYYPDKRGNLYVTVGAIDDEESSLLSHYLLILLITFLGSILIAWVAGWYFIGRALKPISDIVKSVSDLSPVERSERLAKPYETQDELYELVATFNLLFDKLETSFKSQKSFVSNASHELLNPVTVIKTQLEVCLMQPRDSAVYEHTLRSILEDLNTLIDLIKGLLEFSKLESNYSLPTQALRLDDLLWEVREKLMEYDSNYLIAIKLPTLVNGKEDCSVIANKALLFKAILNIVENACKYSPDHQARLELSCTKNEICLEISDNGPGMPAEELSHIFTPFYRLPGNEQVKGHGIGLALAQAILKVHDITLQVYSEVGKGSRFSLLFSN